MRKLTYTVALMTDYGYGFEDCRPLAIGVDKATAKSIERWYTKHVCEWSDYSQTGTWINVVNREFCMNHGDFEVERRALS